MSENDVILKCSFQLQECYSTCVPDILGFDDIGQWETASTGNPSFLEFAGGNANPNSQDFLGDLTYWLKTKCAERPKITAVTPVCDMVGPVEEVAAECGKPSKCGPYTLNDYRSGDRDPIHKKKIGLSYGLKKHFVFWLQIPYSEEQGKKLVVQMCLQNKNVI